MRSPHDFPRGFAETHTPPFTRVLFDLEDDKILDAGIRDYGEFFANLDHGWELLHRPQVVIDSRPGTVSVVHRFQNMVQLKWRPLDGGYSTANACRWGEKQ